MAGGAGLGLLSAVRATHRGRGSSAARRSERPPELRLGERAFEIVLARAVEAGQTGTVWFTRHGSTPITEVPAHWPVAYREVVQRRIETIERRRDLALI